MDQEDREAARIGDLAHLEGRAAAAQLHEGACNARDEDGRSLLHIACAGGNLPVVQLIADHGGKPTVNGSDDEGWTPLMSAISAGREAIAEYLLSLGADVSASNSGGQTALHYAASKGHLACLRLLLRAGAASNSKDHHGNTPLHRAASAGKAEAARVLLEEGKAKLEDGDRRGQTPLFVAVESGNQRVALYLAAKGAKLDAANKDEETPLAIADAEMRKALVNAAASGLEAEED